MRRQFLLFFTLFSVALYILTMSIHIAAKKVKLLIKFFFSWGSFVRNLLLRISLKTLYVLNSGNMFGYTGDLQGPPCICHGNWYGNAINFIHARELIVDHGGKLIRVELLVP